MFLVATSDIHYPVYCVPITFDPITEGTVTYVYTEYEGKEEGEAPTPVLKILDDKSVQGDTLGKRRLNMLDKEVPLCYLGKAIFFLGDLIKLADTKQLFIDSSGRLFKYKKSIRANLLYLKVKQIIPIAAGGALVEIEGIPYRLKSLFRPSVEEHYAAVLKVGMGYILYGFSEVQKKSTWRKV